MTSADAHGDVEKTSAGEDIPNERDETPAERADRNWLEIVQELRVTQTGTQILAGFLLTVAFQSTFADLPAYQHVVYLILVLLAAATTTLGFLPVSLHRTMFRRHEKPRLVTQADVILKVVLVLVSLLTAGVVFFLFDVTTTLAIAVAVGGLVAVGMVAVLFVFPLVSSRRRR
jgi:hypothetical protein